MELIEVKRLVESKIKQHKLRGWSFSFNRRKVIVGLCNHVEKVIQLSQYYTTICDKDKVVDTILHEIAHAIVGPTKRDGHGEAWRKVCVKIGANPDRGHHIKEEVKVYRYLYTCPKCGWEYRSEKRLFNDKTLFHKACGNDSILSRNRLDK